MSYISTKYILCKQLGRDKTRQALMGIRTICTVCNSGGKEIDLALVSDMKDFEDSKIPIMSAEEYIKLNQ